MTVLTAFRIAAQAVTKSTVLHGLNELRTAPWSILGFMVSCAYSWMDIGANGAKGIEGGWWWFLWLVPSLSLFRSFIPFHMLRNDDNFSTFGSGAYYAMNAEAGDVIWATLYSKQTHCKWKIVLIEWKEWVVFELFGASQAIAPKDRLLFNIGYNRRWPWPCRPNSRFIASNVCPSSSISFSATPKHNWIVVR